ncbi:MULTISPECIES: hypothetical protein [Bacteroides]|uniref:Uncharacterized protein n=2 Tax=Bacteroides TaxID=816 RepID=A0A9X2P5W0_9BACE|nr:MULTISPECIES: hypothetical protein [Bacteroides]MCR6505328.1 hypothetical protein [Bacteroides muris (ex Fokt et al. 2023)]MCR6509707.1 hypothetical protein [Bacteroides muris (ex Fokt et al. 2023)]NVK93465.1 hypothetical protein [Bacteroides sp. L10-4]TGY06093.1 hypothetical protein E5355_09835 [Bacteroides muris (ex Afrizal et al. 2022)]
MKIYIFTLNTYIFNLKITFPHRLKQTHSLWQAVLRAEREPPMKGVWGLRAICSNRSLEDLWLFGLIGRLFH